MLAFLSRIWTRCGPPAASSSTSEPRIQAGIRSGRELNPFVGQPQHRAQGFHQTGFGQAGHANQQGVAARQQSDQGFIYYRFLSKDDPTGHLPDPGDTFYRHLDVSDQLFVGFADR
jgi:hypothetical protein